MGKLARIVCCASMLFAVLGVAGPAVGEEILQDFRIVSFNQQGWVSATGAQINGTGTATETTPTAYTLSFPGSEPVYMTLTPRTTATRTVACVKTVQRTGTFEYSHALPQIGGAEGGSGPYTSTQVTVRESLPGGGCDAPVYSTRTVDARASEIHIIA